MRSKSRSHAPRTSKLKNQHVVGKQRGNSTTMVLLILALLISVGAVWFLIAQTSKFQFGRTGGELVVEPEPMVAGEDQAPQMSLSPTVVRKKGLLENLFGKKDEPATEAVANEPTIPTPTIFVRPIQKGRLDFTITQGAEMAGPLFIKGMVSDFATAANIVQTVTVYFDKQRPAQSVSAQLLTDTKQTPITMQKQADEGGYEVWKGEWKLEDTNNLNMAINFEATSQQGTSIAGVAVR